ncbi:MAG: tRNA pseudouridine(55) synthase TruB, partial [Actinobacteria bacterium]|nr:tRNA pseudouridine(55) synthase TruB [Actinomycetota bacterium]
SGIALIDKQQGFTSHDVVAKLRKLLGTKKIGHAGTLDPMATGLLLMGVGAGTKLMQFLSGLDKTYLATIRLGASSSTDDAQGELGELRDASQVSREQLETEILKLTGNIEQVPSSVSAIKVDGKRAYDLVRAGEEVVLKSRRVTVSRFEIVGEPLVVEKYLDINVEVDCSSGTYIRALARDLGDALGVGGHLTALRRTRIGSFEVSNAREIAQEPTLVTNLEVLKTLMPEVAISPQQEIDLRHGKRLALEISGTSCATANGRLVAVIEPVGSEAKSSVVFPEEA